jgi:fimbrial chaperone protein
MFSIPSRKARPGQPAFSPRWPAALVLGALTLAGTDARASNFSIDLTRVYLTAEQPSALITIRNDSDAALRLQISTRAWGQTPDEALHLETTEEVVFFPALLTIQPRQSRPIRVGYPHPMQAVERAYRLFIEELPAARADGATQLTVLTRLSVPVFVQKTRATAATGQSMQVERVAVTHDTVHVSVVNQGAMHAMVDQVRVLGSGADGTALFEGQAAGWYVLAGSRQTFAVPATTTCPEGATLGAELRIGAELVQHTVPCEDPSAGK